MWYQSGVADCMCHSSLSSQGRCSCRAPQSQRGVLKGSGTCTHVTMYAPSTFAGVAGVAGAAAEDVASVAAADSRATVASVAAEDSQPKEASAAAPGVASVAAPGKAAANDAVEGDGLPKGARKIADLEKPSGAVHLGNGDIYVTFSRAVASLRKRFLLHSVFDGTIKTKNSTQDGCISYHDVHRGSYVSMESEIAKLGDFLADDVQEVWGKDVQGGKVLPKLLANGTAVDLYWSARTEEDKEACKALLTIEGVQPLFAMTQNQKGRELQPSGVLFVLHNGIKFEKATKVAKLPRQA